MKLLTSALLALALASSVALPASPVMAKEHKIKLINRLNFDVVSVKLRHGKVSGFYRIPTDHYVELGVEMNDGSCGGYLVARYPKGDAAQALINICGGGTFEVTINPRVGNAGTALDLTIKPVRKK